MAQPSRTIVAGIWVAFFQECQRQPCGQATSYVYLAHGTEFCIAPGLAGAVFHRSLVNYSRMCFFDAQMFLEAANSIVPEVAQPKSPGA